MKTSRRTLRRKRSQLFGVLVAFACVPACSKIVGADFDNLLPLEEDASAGRGGSAGTAGSAGNDASAGTSGSAGIGGSAGTSGNAGTSGSGGTAGSAGTGGKGGAAGSAGVSGSAGTAGVGGSAGTAGDGGTCDPTPDIDAGAVTGDPTTDIVINEVQGYTDLPLRQDYVELYNKGAAAVNISGLKVGDAEGGGPCGSDSAVFPTGTIMPAHGYVVVVGNSGNSSGPACCFDNVAPCYTANFGIKSDGETVYLCSATREIINQAVYPGADAGIQIPKGQSYSRIPDGTGEFAAGRNTPGAENQPP